MIHPCCCSVAPLYSPAAFKKRYFFGKAKKPFPPRQSAKNADKLEYKISKKDIG